MHHRLDVLTDIDQVPVDRRPCRGSVVGAAGRRCMADQWRETAIELCRDLLLLRAGIGFRLHTDAPPCSLAVLLWARWLCSAGSRSWQRRSNPSFAVSHFHGMMVSISGSIAR